MVEQSEVTIPVQITASGGKPTINRMSAKLKREEAKQQNRIFYTWQLYHLYICTWRGGTKDEDYKNFGLEEFPEIDELDFLV